MDKVSGKSSPQFITNFRECISTNTPPFTSRPEHVKRSHTLRYVLKDLGSDKLLFAVLFTLYLKEDVDEDGNLKEGVEGGKPLSLMSDKEREIHEAKVCGVHPELSVSRGRC